MQTTFFSPALGDVTVNMPLTNNYAASTNPAATSDSSKGYQVGAQWVNTTKNIAWSCMNATVGQAVWVTDASVQGSPAAQNTAATLTASNLEAGIITSNPAGAINLQLPLASAMDAEFPSYTGTSIDFIVINTNGTNAPTLTTNTGWTLVGAMAVAANTSGRFRAVKTGATATWTLYRIG